MVEVGIMEDEEETKEPAKKVQIRPPSSKSSKSIDVSQADTVAKMLESSSFNFKRGARKR